MHAMCCMTGPLPPMHDLCMIRAMRFPIIEKLGGRDAVAKLLAGKVKANAVRMWHARGRIPSDAQLVLMEAADRRSIRYTASDFRAQPVARMSFSIDEEIKNRFEAVAEHLGLDGDQVLREALLEKIEELEDYRVMRERLDRPHTRIANDQVWRELDLED
jgi:RHH-type transcriptional regulator, rel operon repressor / antitoxin RelB